MISFHLVIRLLNIVCVYVCACVCVCVRVSVCIQSFSHVRFCVTPWTVARQAPPSMGFPRQEYWSGLPFPPPEDLTAPGVKLLSPGLALNHLGGLGMDHIDLLTTDGASQGARW